jgi:aromatic ring-opening dioxygenase catalytic subunit (LigB family)
MFPEETPLDVPVIQVSTFHGYDLASQIRLGEVVGALRYVGSMWNILLGECAADDRMQP